MSSATETRCTVEVPFDLRLTIQLYTTEEHLEKATEHLQEPNAQWGLQAYRVVQRWINQEIAPQLLREIRAISPCRNLDSEVSWLTGVRACRSEVTDITYVADEAGLVDE